MLVYQRVPFFCGAVISHRTLSTVFFSAQEGPRSYRSLQGPPNSTLLVNGGADMEFVQWLFLMCDMRVIRYMIISLLIITYQYCIYIYILYAWLINYMIKLSCIYILCITHTHLHIYIPLSIHNYALWFFVFRPIFGVSFGISRPAISHETEELPERSYVLHPGGSFRTGWNLSMAACVLYDPWQWWGGDDGGFQVASGYVKIAIENDHRNSGFSHWKLWFSIVMLVYQRVAPRPGAMLRLCQMVI